MIHMVLSHLTVTYFISSSSFLPYFALVPRNWEIPKHANIFPNVGPWDASFLLMDFCPLTFTSHLSRLQEVLPADLVWLLISSLEKQTL